jgi:very-short-patch-repair endonuclease
MPSIRASGLYGGRSAGLPRNLRRASTDAESVLWKHLRGRAIAGAKFRRQQPLGPYILDFYCHERCLVIEVDGGQHFEPEAELADRVRTGWLEGRGLTVLRFSNLEVLNETTAVLERIFESLSDRSPHPNPLPEGEGIRVNSPLRADIDNAREHIE